MSDKRNVYEKLLNRVTPNNAPTAAPQRGHSGGRFDFRGGTPANAAPSGRFSPPSSSPAPSGRSPQSNQGYSAPTPKKPVDDRPQPQAVHKDGRVLAADRNDRDLAYQPPVRNPNQAISWSPPSLRDILADLGLRLIEVGIASMAQEIAYFFAHRRFLPKYLQRG